jgi:phage-related protein
MKFYSDLTKQLYETEDELLAAEKAQIEATSKKEAAAKEKKEDAKKVEDAFKARNAARTEFNKKVLEARKEYSEALASAKKSFNDAISNATKDKDTAEKEFNSELKAFNEKHKEGFHITLKDGDNVLTLSSQGESEHSESKEYSGLLDYLLKSFWK